MRRNPTSKHVDDLLLAPGGGITSGRIVHLIGFCILLVMFQIFMARKQSSSLSLSKEAKRRWQHAITGHALVQVSYFLPVSLCIAGLFLGCCGIYYIRFHQAEVYVRVFGPLLRVDEMHSQNGQRILPGAFYFLLGTALTAALFPLPIARYAVECLAWADPMAAWIGQSSVVLGVSWSPKIHAKASVAGCIACFVTATSIGYVMLILMPPSSSSSDGGSGGGGGGAVVQQYSFWQVVVGGLACFLAEAFPYGNDNLLIPLVTATALSMTT
jgi:dolichol kinase